MFTKIKEISKNKREEANTAKKFRRKGILQDITKFFEATVSDVDYPEVLVIVLQKDDVVCYVANDHFRYKAELVVTLSDPEDRLWLKDTLVKEGWVYKDHDCPSYPTLRLNLVG